MNIASLVRGAFAQVRQPTSAEGAFSYAALRFAVRFLMGIRVSARVSPRLCGPTTCAAPVCYPL